MVCAHPESPRGKALVEVLKRLEGPPLRTCAGPSAIVAADMIDGNPGALHVLGELIEQDPWGEHGRKIVPWLYQRNIIGPSLWILYKDHCNEDIDTLMKFIMGIVNDA